MRRSLCLLGLAAWASMTSGCNTDDRDLQVNLPHCTALLTCCDGMQVGDMQLACINTATGDRAAEADSACAAQLDAYRRADPPLCP